ncbi:MAG: 50S ribosomal protein L3 [Ignavibacteria bacterium]|nr:50S ribosomal protein L3 [Ignavibacteria bacterium]
MSALLGKKLGMTSIFNDKGDHIPVTVIEAGPCPVVQIKTIETDGYTAVQIGFGEIASRKINQPQTGHFQKAGIDPVRHLKEFRHLPTTLSVGEILTVDGFQKGDKVVVSGTGKGRGFQGVVKRHHFGGVGMATHGQSDRPRAPGSIGSSSYPSRVFKGLRMAGRMGGKRITVRNLEIIEIMPDTNIILVKGNVPGAINSLVEIVKH